MNNSNNQLKVNTNTFAGGQIRPPSLNDLIPSPNDAANDAANDASNDDAANEPSNDASNDEPSNDASNDTTTSDSSNNAKNDDVDMTKLVKETLQKIHDQMCISIEDNSDTLTNNVQNMIIKNSDWKYLGKQLTDIFTSKVSSMLNNIDLMIVATDNNEFPEMNDKNDNDKNDNDKNDNDKNDNDDPVAEPDSETELDTETITPVTEENSKENTEENTEENSKENTEKSLENEEEATDQNPDDPSPHPAHAVSGGKKRKSIKVKYLSKNKTRKNLI